MTLGLNGAMKGLKAVAAPAAILALGLAVGLCGLNAGLPGAQRLKACFNGIRPSQKDAQLFAQKWRGLYQSIKRSHQNMEVAEPVTYAQSRVEVLPGWRFPPDALVNSCRSFLLQSVQPDEKKAFIILSQMRPWKLQFEPLYIQYGGAFIYPLGAFLAAASVLRLAHLTSDMAHYLRHPEDMRRLYLLARIFILIFGLGSLLALYHMGKYLAGAGAGFLAALFFLLCPIIINNSHLIKPHPYAAFWALAALWQALRARETGAGYRWCGLLSGMAFGSSLTLALFAALPAWIWLEKKLSRPDDLKPLEWRQAAEGCAIALGVCLLTNPYLILAFHDFAWEILIYGHAASGSHLAGLWSLALSAQSGMGLVLSVVSAAALLWALARGGAARFLSAFCLACAGILWLKYGTGEDVFRLYYALIGVACLLSVLWIRSWRARWLQIAVLSAIFIDTGLRGAVATVNFWQASRQSSTRHKAAAWINRHIPPGSSLGLARFPEPAHLPVFALNRYRLVILGPKERADPAGFPDYLIVDAEGNGLLDNTYKVVYDPLVRFPPFGFAWAKSSADPDFLNTGFFIYKKARIRR